MNNRKRSATNGDTPRPKKTRSVIFDKHASSKASLPPPAMRTLRKLPSKPNHLKKYTTASSESTSSDSISPGKTANRWSETEDACLVEAVDLAQKTDSKLAGNQVWVKVAQKMPTKRSAKQCRERWINFLRPDIKKGEWTTEEEQLIHDLYRQFGPRWSKMAETMKGRTDNDLKNKWNGMKRSQDRKSARLSQQVSASSTKTESVESLELNSISISPKKLALTPPADACITLSKQEDEKNVTEV